MSAYKYIELDRSKTEETDCQIRRDKYGNETCSSMMGLAGAVHSCYNKHCVLTIGADDFWLSILTVYMQYCKKDANKSTTGKYLFRNGGIPESKIPLKTEFAPRTIARDVEQQAIRQLTNANGVNKDLIKLFLESFSSSKNEHKLAKAFCVLKSYEEYISYTMMCYCGIPGVKMLGDLSDWKKLKNMVSELKRHAENMKLPCPIPDTWWDEAADVCQNLIATYEESDKDKTAEWWSKIISSERHGSGSQVDWTGWLPRLLRTDFLTPMPHFRVEMPVTFNGGECLFLVEATNWNKFRKGELGMREMGVTYRWNILQI